MTTLNKRLIFSSIFVTITVYTIFYSPAWLFFIVISLFALIGFREYMGLAVQKGVTFPLPLAIAIASVIPFSVAFSFETAGISIAAFAIFIYHFRPKSQENAFTNSAFVLFGMIYVVFFFSLFLKMRGYEHGAAWIFYTVLVIKTGDAGAYFTGRKIGKTKLIPHISPNKSVEGAVAGLLTSIVFSLISKTYLPHAPIGHLLALGIVLSILSQFADLAESLLKRDVHVKDSGQIPGLGGILDILDSLLLTVPFMACYLHLVDKF